MEFLLVVCKDDDDPSEDVDREVFLDGVNEVAGLTGVLMRVDAGPHDVDLGRPENYEPQEQHILLRSGSTSQSSPRRLTFRIV